MPDPSGSSAQQHGPTEPGTASPSQEPPSPKPSGPEPSPGAEARQPPAPADREDWLEDEPPATPAFEEETRALAPSVRTIWTIKLAGVALVFVLAALLYDTVGFFSRTGHALPVGVLTGVAVVLLGAWAFFWPRLRYRHWRFALRAEELYLERGVLNRVRTIVPLRRIQHLDVSQDLLEREFDLGKLVVHTAGTRSADVVVPGLHYDEAERLRDEVKRYVLALREDPL